ncbi:hypothetical protein Anapl_12716 [Anas platyrhynchos]|uniref:Uncharacterized protein n=1 Tax=Anas platyrhynchos TaxID=8839 RepID=R0L4Z6_ANAPL|nr:hypothetical protein Anapl_12716 [Anas platyrhynchos]
MPSARDATAEQTPNFLQQQPELKAKTAAEEPHSLGRWAQLDDLIATDPEKSSLELGYDTVPSGPCGININLICMQLQNGFTRSVPHFSQNTATTRAETQSAVKAKTGRTSTPKLLIICKRIGDYNHRSHSCEGPKIRGTSPCQTREPLIIKQSSDSLTPHLWASVPPPDKVNNETQQLHVTLIDIF